MTAAALLTYALPLRQLRITGKNQDSARLLSATDVAEAVAAARQVGVGWCAARNITHTGAIGYFALQAAEAGMAARVVRACDDLRSAGTAISA